MKTYLWHLVNSDDSIVRSTEADHVQQARLRLAPIERTQVVVSALSHAVKESREIVAARQSRCDICGNTMHGERAGIYNNTHRACYEKARKIDMTPEERERYRQQRKKYRDTYRAQALTTPVTHYGRRDTTSENA